MSDDRVNAYYCPTCQDYIVTVDRVEGTTPMFLACRVLGEPTDPANTCKGQMQSMGYPAAELWPIPREPTWEWYAPDDRERAGLSDEARDHVERGGLLIRAFSAAEAPRGEVSVRPQEVDSR